MQHHFLIVSQKLYYLIKVSSMKPVTQDFSNDKMQ